MATIEMEDFQEKLDDFESKRFLVEDKIGEGSNGIVWKVQDLKKGYSKEHEYVAIKEPKHSEDSEIGPISEHFEQIVKLNIRHPNVIKTLGLIDLIPENLLVMECLDYSMVRTLRKKKRLSEKESVSTVMTIAKALDEAIHSIGYCHRDIRPPNILIHQKTNTIKLGDLGLMKLNIDMSSNLQGAFNYISLEQCIKNSEGLYDAGPTGDIFSLGVVFYELLSGTKPFPGNDLDEVNQLKADSGYISRLNIRNVDSKLMDIIRTCIQPDKNNRYQTARDFIKAIKGEFVINAPVNLDTIQTKINHVRQYVNSKKVYGTTDPDDVLQIRNKIIDLESFLRIKKLKSNSSVSNLIEPLYREIESKRQQDYSEIYQFANQGNNPSRGVDWLKKKYGKDYEKIYNVYITLVSAKGDHWCFNDEDDPKGNTSGKIKHNGFWKNVFKDIK